MQNTATSWSYDDTGTTHATSFTYQARVIDAVNNVGTTASQPVTIDNTAPASGTLSFSNLTDSGTANTPPVTQDNAFDLTLSGQEAGASVVYQVSLNGGAFTATTASQSGLADGELPVPRAGHRCGRQQLDQQRHRAWWWTIARRRPAR